MNVSSYGTDSVNISDATDYKKFNFPKEIWIIIPDWELSVKISTFIPFILIGIVGNSVLINIILRNRALQTPTNLILANMAAADLFTIIVGPILFMFNDFYQIYQLGPVGCKLEGFLEGSLLITSVVNLVAVSYDRLTAIVLPTETRLTVKGAYFVMASSWIFGFTIAIPLSVYRKYKEREWKNFLETYCWENTVVLPMYWHVLIAALVWFPLGVMMICYTAILWKLDRYEKKVLHRENRISISYKTKAAKTLFIVVITFIVLRVPFTVLIMIRNKLLNESTMNQANGSFQILSYTAHYLLFVNSAINPLIYGLTNDNFRRAYYQTPILPTCCNFTRKCSQRNIIKGRFKIYFHQTYPKEWRIVDKRKAIKKSPTDSPIQTLSTKATNSKENLNKEPIEFVDILNYNTVYPNILYM